MAAVLSACRAEAKRRRIGRDCSGQDPVVRPARSLRFFTNRTGMK